jgi:hypothetical protein
MRSIARSLVAAAMLPMAASHLGLIASNEPTKPAAGAGGPSVPDRLVLISARRYWTRRAECTASAVIESFVVAMLTGLLGRGRPIIRAFPN